MDGPNSTCFIHKKNESEQSQTNAHNFPLFCMNNDSGKKTHARE